MGGPGSGPKPSNLAEYVKKHVNERASAVVGALSARASGGPVTCPQCEAVFEHPVGGDRESAIYLLDRVLGRPRQEIDQRVTAHVQLSGDDYAVLARALAVEAKLLTATPVLEGEKPTEIYENLQLEAENVSEDGAHNVGYAHCSDVLAAPVGDWTPPTPPDTSDIVDITRFRAQSAEHGDQEQPE